MKNISHAIFHAIDGQVAHNVSLDCRVDADV